jgi:hypothetical protein
MNSGIHFLCTINARAITMLLENAWAWEISTWLTWRKARFSS